MKTTKSIFSVLLVGGIFSMSACASSGSEDLVKENVFVQKTMVRCQNYLEGKTDPKNDRWCSKHMPGQKGNLKNISLVSGELGYVSGSGMLGGGSPGKNTGSGSMQNGISGVATPSNSGMGDLLGYGPVPVISSSVFEPMNLHECKDSHTPFVMYSFVIKEAGHVVNESRVQTQAGCRTAVSSLENNPYLTSESKILLLEGLSKKPVVAEYPRIDYVTTGVQIIFLPEKKDPSRIHLSLRTANLVEMIRKSGRYLPVIASGRIDDNVVLKKGSYVKIPKTITWKGKKNKIHTYSISVKEE